MGCDEQADGREVGAVMEQTDRTWCCAAHGCDREGCGRQGGPPPVVLP